MFSVVSGCFLGTEAPVTTRHGADFPFVLNIICDLHAPKSCQRVCRL